MFDHTMIQFSRRVRSFFHHTRIEAVRPLPRSDVVAAERIGAAWKSRTQIGALRVASGQVGKDRANL